MVRRYRPYVDDPVLRPEDSALYARSWYFGSVARPGRVQGIRERFAHPPRLAARGDGPGRNPGFPHDKRYSNTIYVLQPLGGRRGAYPCFREKGDRKRTRLNSSL